MSTNENSMNASPKVAFVPILAALVALVGLADAVYLTVHHYTGEKVPCTITGEGCGIVLASYWSEVQGIPLAAFGALAYFVAFSLAILAGFGDRRMWPLFGIQATIMALVSGFLLYVQAFQLEAFCQFCLLSAGTSFTLFLIFIVSRFLRKK